MNYLIDMIVSLNYRFLLFLWWRGDDFFAYNPVNRINLFCHHYNWVHLTLSVSTRLKLYSMHKWVNLFSNTGNQQFYAKWLKLPQLSICLPGFNVRIYHNYHYYYYTTINNNYNNYYNVLEPFEIRVRLTWRMIKSIRTNEWSNEETRTSGRCC